MPNIKVSEEDRLRFSNKLDPVEGDPDFSEKQNRDVIARTIKRSEKIRAQKKKQFDDGLHERSDLIYSYIRNISSGGNSDKTIYDYASRDLIMKLLGEEKADEIRRRAFIQGYNINYNKGK